jgi:hypothetical protein
MYTLLYFGNDVKRQDFGLGGRVVLGRLPVSSLQKDVARNQNCALPTDLVNGTHHKQTQVSEKTPIKVPNRE